jgi:hypothetical protein
MMSDISSTTEPVEPSVLDKQDHYSLPSASGACSTLSHSMSQTSFGFCMDGYGLPDLSKKSSKILTNNNYKLIKVIGKGTYSTVYLSSLDVSTKFEPPQEIPCFEKHISENTKFDEEIQSALSEVLQCSKSVSVKEINESILNFENLEKVEYQALKIIQRPNFNKQDKTY